MASTDGAVVSEGSLGVPTYLSYEKIMLFNIHNFEGLSNNKGNYETTRVACHGRDWYIRIYPWGGNTEAKENGMMSVFLGLEGAKNLAQPLKVKWHVRVKDRKRQFSFAFDPISINPRFGTYEFMKRSDALEAVDEFGTLTITVGLCCGVKSAPIWRPENALKRKLRQLYNSGDDKDVSFIMANAEEIRAHKFIVSLHCPLLKEVISQATNPSRIILDGPDPGLFATMIRFMYHEALPNTFEMIPDGLELLKLANQYEYVDLKIYMECEVVQSKMLSVENAAEMLLLANSHSFALLKEQTTEFVLGNFAAVMKSEGWRELTESSALLAELLMARHLPKDGAESECVSALRKKLVEAGRDIDGTKEMLVQRWKEYSDSVAGANAK